AISLAQAAGSYHHGVAMMNAEARHLQADDTVAVRPNGLNAKGQHTSAYDLALFARQALRMPEFLRIERLHVAKFPLYRRAKVNLWNQNSLLGSYPGDIAGKIGWTSQARATYIGWARRGGHTLIVTLMHCTPLTEMVFAAKLLNWGFAMDGKVRPVGQLAAPLPARTAGHPVPPRPARSRRARRRCWSWRRWWPGSSPWWSGARRAEEAHPVHDRGHGLLRHRARPGRAVGQQPVQLGLVGQHLPGALPDRRQRAHHHLGQVLLERAVPGPGVPGREVRDVRPGQCRVDAQQVGHARLGRFVGPDAALGIGHRPGDLLADRGGLVQHVDDARIRRRGLAHLRGRLLQVGDLGHTTEDVSGWHRERRPVPVVEPDRQVAAQLQVLALVLADRYLVGLVEQNVGRLQHRVAEQPEARLLRTAPGRLVLELGHPAELAEPGQAA